MGVKIKSIKWENIQLPPTVRANLYLVIQLMYENGWTMIKFHESNYIMNLERGKVKMNVYLTTLTIQTSMNHPKKGKTQLNRKKLTQNELKTVFKNPRVHTKKGYY